MRAPDRHISVALVEDAGFAKRVAPRCGELLHDFIDNRFVRAMGPRRLGELQRYAAFSRFGMIVVALAGDRVIGSGCAAYDSRKLLIDCLVKRIWLFVPAILKSLLSPRTLVHMIRTAGYGRHDFMKGLPDAEFIYMSIDEDYRGTGVADDMLELVFAQFGAAGITQIKGMSSEHNPRAHGFAKACGARLVDEANLYPERRSHVYVLDIAEYEASKRKLAAE
jgi:GNAT superfamily N-acetyltransferase